GHDPALGLRQRTAFADLDDITEVELVLLVVSVVLARVRHDLAVELVLRATLDQDRHGLVACIADHLAHQRAGHFGLSVRHWAAPFFSVRIVFARAMSRRVFFRAEWSLSCWVARCMRRLKCDFSRSLISVSSAATSLARSSEAFAMTFSFALRIRCRTHGPRTSWTAGAWQQPA